MYGYRFRGADIGVSRFPPMGASLNEDGVVHALAHSA